MRLGITNFNCDNYTYPDYNPTRSLTTPLRGDANKWDAPCKSGVSDMGSSPAMP